MDHVMIKLAHVFLPVHQIECTESFFIVILEFSLVLLPVLLKVVEVCIVEGVVQRDGLFIINSPLSRKRIILPIPLISKLFIWVIKSSIPIHSTILPISVIDAPISIAELPFPMSQTILLLPSVNTSIFVLLRHNITFHIRSFLIRNLWLVDRLLRGFGMRCSLDKWSLRWLVYLVSGVYRRVLLRFGLLVRVLNEWGIGLNVGLLGLLLM